MIDLPSRLKAGDSQIVLSAIHDVMEMLDCSIMDAILWYCEKYEIEIEYVAAIIKKDTILCSRLQHEASKLNMLKEIRPSGNTLPI